MTGCLCCHDRSPTVGCMTTTVTHSLVDCAQRVVKRDPVDELNETIAYYLRYDDRASEQQVRRLRKIRDGILHPDPAVIPCSAMQP